MNDQKSRESIGRKHEHLDDGWGVLMRAPEQRQRRARSRGIIPPNVRRVLTHDTGDASE
jgi:hypothetical protein